MMTPAEELTMAADKLDELAREATPDFNSLDEAFLVLFPEDLAYLAAMNPLVGKELSKLMRCAARMLTHKGGFYERMVGTLGSDFDGMAGYALGIARLINGGAS